MSKRALSVRELNAIVASYLNNPQLANVEVEGECSSPKLYPSGHFYFTLKDPGAAVSCVMFRSDVARQKELPKAGDAIVVQAGVGLYERDGRYQLYVRSISHAGIGKLWQEFEQLKKKLEAKGYFSPERKKSLPFLPKKIGIVTSSHGAAVRDIVEVSLRRMPGLELQLIPVRVQGEGAAEEIAGAIELFNALNDVDLLIVGRGGGSLEDLWAFNEEIVAESILASKIPVISAVGHEIDFSISDFVADLRAPTPSAAAELAVPVKEELYKQLEDMQYRLERIRRNMLTWRKQTLQNLLKRLVYRIEAGLKNEEQRLDRMYMHPVFRSPQHSLTLRQDRLKNFMKMLYLAYRRIYDKKENELSLLTQKKEVLNPWKTLQRGFVAAFDENGELLTKAQYIKKDMPLQLVFADGEVKACAMEVRVN